ncbi:MAG: hypothetical protein ACLFWD_14010 [Anaerolineales bacterium]
MITLFTAPKAFENHIGRIQRNAIRSWLALGEQVEVLMIGSEAGMGRAAAELGVTHLPKVARNEQGTPRIDSIFDLADEYAAHPLRCYLNADVMLMPDFLPAVERVHERFEKFLMVGQRWDVEVEQEFTLAELTEPDRLAALLKQAELHPPGGSDYFVFHGSQYQQMPPFALGRSGWDNWMIYAARAAGHPVVDASKAVTVLHQQHDYAHLPGGQSHYRLPESERNVALAGGREMMFTLKDANWRLDAQGLKKVAALEPGRWRRLEANMIARFGPGRASQLTRLLFHLPETLRYFMARPQAGRKDVESHEAPAGRQNG